MPAYRVRVVDDDGQFVVGATLNCVDDVAAKAKFAALPLPAGWAELTVGARLVEARRVGEPQRTAGKA